MTWFISGLSELRLGLAGALPREVAVAAHGRVRRVGPDVVVGAVGDRSEDPGLEALDRLRACYQRFVGRVGAGLVEDLAEQEAEPVVQEALLILVARPPAAGG